MNRPLSEFVPRNVSQASVNAHWAKAEARLFGAPRVSWTGRFAFAGATAVMLVVAAGWWLTRPLTLEVGTPWVAAAPSTLVLSDGSKVEVAQGGSVVLGVNAPERVELTLLSGAAKFDVAKNPQRKFVVHASAVAVEVVGTRFRVQKDSEGQVSVEVEEGTVDVYAHGRTQRLLAGQQSGPLALQQEAVPEVDERVSEAEEAAEPIRPTEIDEEVREPKPRASIKRAPKAEGSAADALFGRALAARSTRRWQLAARLAERFLKEHPTDPRAGLMAFELGRVQADQLGQREAAMDAYARAMRIDPQADFIDDLLVRWAEAAYADGDAATCAQKRDEYLKRFPRGQLRTTVQSLCGSK